MFKGLLDNKYKSCPSAYFGINEDDRFIVASEFYWWTDNIDVKPATKEQRDLLFSKMKEAGYEWDSEKKELKMITSNF